MLRNCIIKVAKRPPSFGCLSQVQVRGFARPGTPKGSKSGRGTDNEGSERKREDKRLIEAFNKFIETAEEAKRLKPDFTEAELAEHALIHKRYHSELRKQQNAFNKDLALANGFLLGDEGDNDTVVSNLSWVKDPRVNT